MITDLYKDPICARYAKLITDVNKTIKRVYFGEPIRIGASELPALIIEKTDTSIRPFTNMEDQHDIKINFTIVTDVRQTISDDKQLVAGFASLYNIIEGRDATYKLKVDSILGILRKNAEVDPGLNLRTDLETASRAVYGMTLGKRQDDHFSIEGSVQITAHFIQLR